MRLRQHIPTDRAQSEVIGAVLVFALVLAVLTLVQVMAVPSANEQVEFKHSQAAQQDVQELSAAIDRVTTTGTGESATIESGVYYPNRLFLLNPPPAAGTVRIGQTDQPIGVSNAVALDRETADYWNGTGQEFTTSTVRYRADYNYYDNSPTTVLESGLVYNEFAEAGGVEHVIEDEGDIVQGRQITLTALEGNLSRSSVESMTVRAAPLSAPMNRISVQGADSEPVQLRLPTSLTEEEWREVLADELCEDPNGDNECDSATGGYITDLSVADPDDDPETPKVLTITMDRGTVYDLRMGRVGIGDSLAPADPYYVTILRGSNTTITTGTAEELVVQVRDRYNNPVSGVAVTFVDNIAESDEDGVVDNGRFQNEDDTGNVTVTSDEQGRATALFRATQNGSIGIAAYAGDLGDANTKRDQAHETVVFTNLRATPGADGGSGTDINPNINPAEGGNLVLVDVNPTDVQGNKVYAYEVTFRNTGEVGRSIEELRYSFGFTSRSSGAEAPPAIRVSGPGFSPTTLNLGGEYESIGSSTVAAGEEITLGVEPVDPDKSFDSFIVLSAILDAGGESESAIYFLDESITNEPLTADFTSTADGLTVQFTDASTDEGGDVEAWAWDFTSDGTIDSTAQNPSHTYPDAGTYLVTLSVTDDEDNIDIVSEEVTVTSEPNTAPTADFTATRRNDGRVDLDASSSADSDGTIASYEWDLDGDGAYDDATGGTVDKQDIPAGTAVGLRVTDDDGATDTVTKTVS